MYHNRLQTPAVERAVVLPRPPAPLPSAGAFVLYPTAWLPGMMAGAWMGFQWVYQQAFEQARAVARPSLPERDLLGVWN